MTDATAPDAPLEAIDDVAEDEPESEAIAPVRCRPVPSEFAFPTRVQAVAANAALANAERAIDAIHHENDSLKDRVASLRARLDEARSKEPAATNDAHHGIVAALLSDPTSQVDSDAVAASVAHATNFEADRAAWRATIAALEQAIVHADGDVQQGLERLREADAARTDARADFLGVCHGYLMGRFVAGFLKLRLETLEPIAAIEREAGSRVGGGRPSLSMARDAFRLIQHVNGSFMEGGGRHEEDLYPLTRFDPLAIDDVRRSLKPPTK